MHRSGSTDLENCPVPEDLLKNLLDATLHVVSDIGSQLPDHQRAALAVYCYRRSHLRQLGLSLAALCSRTALVMEAGHAGELIHVQAQAHNVHDFDTGVRPRGGKAPVSLHVV
ncbi:hypothetical protein [uncultured Roseibium sp.]|uniref:hypothetical protein n=1 Tax=uncultured Roseibium sp. TaxID=1936171 RepID=UPI00262D1D4B|nr:hypothetical protein [uncultured Roseibium sp.]